MSASFRRSPGAGRAVVARLRSSPRLTLLCALVGGTFLLGGSARGDSAALLVLRPFTAMLFVVALATTPPAAWARARREIILAGLILLLPLMHLVPLPPAVWSALPGRALAVEIYRAAGIGMPWHPLSLTPRHSWNAVFSLLGPVAAFLLAVSLSRAELKRLVPVLILCGAASAAVGLLQMAGGHRLYLYAITNEGVAVGLFANRNHQATLIACLVPLLGLWSATMEGPRAQGAHVGAFAGLLMAIPLCLLTGSRSGLLCLGAALPMAVWVHLSGHGSLRTRIALPVTMIAAGALAMLFIVQDRAPAFLRLVATERASELRLRAVPAIWTAVGDYWPWGSGIGSFAEVYRSREPQLLLGPAYLNHAHNEVLELILTGGLPAAMLLASGLVSIMLRAGKAEPGQRPWTRAGIAMLSLCLLASLFDYPLRTPILGTLMALAIAFVIGGDGRDE